MQRLFQSGAVASAAPAAAPEPEPERPEPATLALESAYLNPILHPGVADTDVEQTLWQRMRYMDRPLLIDTPEKASDLLSVCQIAEDWDYRFAVQIQGLLGTDLRSVWQCLSPDSSTEDRRYMMEHFVKEYIDQFLRNQEPSADPPGDDVVQEAVRYYTEFCKKWALAHCKCLSPLVSASAETLMCFYYEELNKVTGSHLTPELWSRFLRRKYVWNAEFARALAAHMNNAEMQRGSRNASYKAMSMNNSNNLRAQQQFGEFLFSHVREFREDIEEVYDKTGLNESPFLTAQLIDWYEILTQLRPPTSVFDRHASAPEGALFGGGRHRRN